MISHCMLTVQKWNASFTLFLPNTTTFCNTAESPFAVVMSPPPQAGIYSLTASHMAEPHRESSGGALWAPTLPRHLRSRSCSCCGSAKTAVPTAAVWLGACKPLPWNSCLISRELTQKCFFSMSPLYLAPKKTSQPYYHQHLQLINLADLGPRVQKFSKGGMRI